MGANRTSFAKLQRDRAKKAKAEAKRARRQGKEMPGSVAVDDEQDDVVVDDDPTTVDEIDELAEISPADLLSMVETLHQQFESKAIDFDEFEERKAALMARLTVD